MSITPTSLEESGFQNMFWAAIYPLSLYGQANARTGPLFTSQLQANQYAADKFGGQMWYDRMMRCSLQEILRLRRYEKTCTEALAALGWSNA